MIAKLNQTKTRNSINSIKITNHGVILVTLRGKQDALSVKRMGEKFKLACEQVISEGKPILALVDLSKLRGANTNARLAGIELLQSIIVERVAIYGASIYLRSIANLVFQAAGQADKLRFFKNEPEARAWLMELFAVGKEDSASD